MSDSKIVTAADLDAGFDENGNDRTVYVYYDDGTIECITREEWESRQQKGGAESGA